MSRKERVGKKGGKEIIGQKGGKEKTGWAESIRYIERNKRKEVGN